MDSFPFGRRKAAGRRAAGRRRVRLVMPPDSPDAIWTDRDAAAAAAAARAGREPPPVPAWERFGSRPVKPPRREAGEDAVLRLRHAEYAASLVMMHRPVPQPPVPARDYGTGPAYDVSRMGQQPS